MLTVDQELKALIPALSEEEYKQLEANIVADGIRESIIVWGNTIIDGHNRYEIASKHNIEYKTIEKHFDSRKDVIEWMILNQFGRRNLSAYQRSILALKLKPILEEKAKKKEALRKTLNQTKPIDVTMLSAEHKAIVNVLSTYKKQPHATSDKIYFVRSEDKVKIGCSCDVESRIKDITKHLPEAKLIGVCDGGISLEKDLHKTLGEHHLNNEWFKINDTTVAVIKAFIPNADFSNVGKVNSNAEVAKKFNISPATLAKVQKIEAKAPEKIKEQIKTGEISINQAYQSIRRLEKVEAVEEKIAEHSETPTGSIDIYNTDKKYNIIYADPAWKYFESGNKNQSLHYNTMTIEEICKLPVKDIADKDCILFLWVTFPILQECFKVMESWGFEYSTCGFNWIKKNKNADSNFFGCGSWTRANSELCLIATKGSITRLDATISQVIETPIEEHSKKPVIVYDLIEKLVGKLPRIELFCRQPHEGWDCFGNEI